MNDCHKFRIWDGFEYCQNKGDYFLDSNGDLRCAIEYEWSGDTLKYASTNLVVEFCIGRKDETGKLIYQGDIIRRKVYWGGPPSSTPKNKPFIEVYSLIEWDEKETQFRATVRGAQWEKCRNEGWATEWYRSFSIYIEGTVEGNIHENKELLEA